MDILNRKRGAVFLDVLNMEIALYKGDDYYNYEASSCKITLDVPALELIIERACKYYKDQEGNNG